MKKIEVEIFTNFYFIMALLFESKYVGFEKYLCIFVRACVPTQLEGLDCFSDILNFLTKILKLKSLKFSKFFGLKFIRAFILKFSRIPKANQKKKL